jgi:hypothetical protein
MKVGHQSAVILRSFAEVHDQQSPAGLEDASSLLNSLGAYGAR